MEDHRYFKSPKDFNRWLATHHRTKDLLWVCYYKKDTGKPSITWEQSVEEALCYGWIDGIRKSVDNESYKIRFTPRRKTSIWSPKNLSTVTKLIQEKRMKDAGLLIYKERKQGHSESYDNMKKDWKLDKSYLSELKADKVAWKFYQTFTPIVRNHLHRWIMTAKKEETRDRRFKKLLTSCSSEELLPQFQWSKKK